MSLIYQALKQSEQRASAAPVIALRAFPAAQTATMRTPISALNKALGWAVVVVALGVTVGYFFQQNFREHKSGLTAEVTSAAGSPPQATPSVVEVPAPASDVPVVATTVQQTPLEKHPTPLPSASLPRALQPLPTASLKLRMVDRLPQAPKAATTPAARLAPPVSSAEAVKGFAGPTVPAPISAMKLAQASAPTSAPVVLLSPSDTTIVSAPDSSVPPLSPKTTPSEDVGALFESMNQALAAHNKTEAQQHLRSIQGRLPDGSIARLRAEAWFAHQTGDLPAASRTYRLLLEKLPGDELSAINLVSIERKQNRPDQARDVVKRALRYNTNSAALRAASDQLSLGRVAQ